MSEESSKDKEKVRIFQLTNALETLATQVKMGSGRLSEEEVEHIKTYFLADPQLDINMQGETQWSLLHVAVKGQSPTLVREILNLKGVDVNIQTSSGRTPLMCAQDPEMVKILLAAGADPGHKVKVASGPEETASEFLLKSFTDSAKKEAFRKVFESFASKQRKVGKQVMDEKSAVPKQIRVSQLPKFKVCQQTKTSHSSYDPKGEVPLIATVQLSQKLKEDKNFTVLLEDDPRGGNQKIAVKIGQLYLEYQSIGSGAFSLDISFIDSNKQMKHCLGVKTLASGAINFRDLLSFDLNEFNPNNALIFTETHKDLLGIVKELNSLFLQASHGTLTNRVLLETAITKFKGLGAPIKTIQFRDKPEKEMQADLNAQLKEKIGHARKIIFGEEKGTKIEDVWKSIEKLIEEGADKNVEEDGISVMQVAVQTRDAIAGKYVEDWLPSRSSVSNELLFLAKDLGMVKKLLKKSADLSHKNKLNHGKTTYEVLKERFSKTDQFPEFLQICLEHELECSVTKGDYFKENTPKISDIITDCVKEGLDVTTIRNSKGHSVLTLAIKERNVSLVTDILHSKKEGLYEEVKGVDSPLVLAVVRNAELTKILLEAGANPNASIDGGESPDTPLFYARDSKIIELLLEAGADINCKNQQGRTPYEELLRSRKSWDGRVEIVSVFLKHELKKKSPNQELINKYEKDKSIFAAALEKEEIRNKENLINLDKYEKHLTEGEKIKSKKVFEDTNFVVLLKDDRRGVKIGDFYFEYGAGSKGSFGLDVFSISKNPNKLIPLLNIEQGRYPDVALSDILPFQLSTDQPRTMVGTSSTKGTPEQQAALEASMDSLRKCFRDNNTKDAPECVANFKKAMNNLVTQSSVEDKGEVKEKSITQEATGSTNREEKNEKLKKLLNKHEAYSSVKAILDLIHQGADVNTVSSDGNGYSALHLAVRTGDKNFVEELLKINGINVNLKSKLNATAKDLITMIPGYDEGTRSEIIKMLEKGPISYQKIKTPVDVLSTEPLKTMPASTASVENKEYKKTREINPEKTKELQALLRQIDKKWGLEEKDIPKIQNLIKEGADVNAMIMVEINGGENFVPHTALSFAVEAFAVEDENEDENVDFVKELIKAGADLTEIYAWNEPIMEFAKTYSAKGSKASKEILAILKEAEASIAAKKSISSKEKAKSSQEIPVQKEKSSAKLEKLAPVSTSKETKEIDPKKTDELINMRGASFFASAFRELLTGLTIVMPWLGFKTPPLARRAMSKEENTAQLKSLLTGKDYLQDGVRNGIMELLKSKNGVDVNVIGDKSALEVAVYNGDPELVGKLLDAGAVVTSKFIEKIRDTEPKSIGNKTEILGLLEGLGEAGESYSSIQLKKLLTNETYSRDKVIKLINERPEVDVNVRRDKSALEFAVDNNDLELVTLLLSKNAILPEDVIQKFRKAPLGNDRANEILESLEAHYEAQNEEEVSNLSEIAEVLHSKEERYKIEEGLLAAEAPVSKKEMPESKVEEDKDEDDVLEQTEKVKAVSAKTGFFAAISQGLSRVWAKFSRSETDVVDPQDDLEFDIDIDAGEVDRSPNGGTSANEEIELTSLSGEKEEVDLFSEDRIDTTPEIVGPQALVAETKAEPIPVKTPAPIDPEKTASTATTPLTEPQPQVGLTTESKLYQPAEPTAEVKTTEAVKPPKSGWKAALKAAGALGLILPGITFIVLAGLATVGIGALFSAVLYGLPFIAAALVVGAVFAVGVIGIAAGLRLIVKAYDEYQDTKKDYANTMGSLMEELGSYGDDVSSVEFDQVLDYFNNTEARPQAIRELALRKIGVYPTDKDLFDESKEDEVIDKQMRFNQAMKEWPKFFEELAGASTGMERSQLTNSSKIRVFESLADHIYITGSLNKNIIYMRATDREGGKKALFGSIEACITKAKAVGNVDLIEKFESVKNRYKFLLSDEFGDLAKKFLGKRGSLSLKELRMVFNGATIKGGQTLLQYALKQKNANDKEGQRLIVGMIRENIAHSKAIGKKEDFVNSKDKDGNTPLMIAINNKEVSFKFLKKLIKECDKGGIDWNIRNEKGQSAIDLINENLNENQRKEVFINILNSNEKLNSGSLNAVIKGMQGEKNRDSALISLMRYYRDDQRKNKDFLSFLNVFSIILNATKDQSDVYKGGREALKMIVSFEKSFTSPHLSQKDSDNQKWTLIELLFTNVTIQFDKMTEEERAEVFRIRGIKFGEFPLEEKSRLEKYDSTRESGIANLADLYKFMFSKGASNHPGALYYQLYKKHDELRGELYNQLLEKRNLLVEDASILDTAELTIIIEKYSKSLGSDKELYNALLGYSNKYFENPEKLSKGELNKILKAHSDKFTKSKLNKQELKQLLDGYLEESKKSEKSQNGFTKHTELYDIFIKLCEDSAPELSKEELNSLLQTYREKILKSLTDEEFDELVIGIDKDPFYVGKSSSLLDHILKDKVESKDGQSKTISAALTVKFIEILEEKGLLTPHLSRVDKDGNSVIEAALKSGQDPQKMIPVMFRLLRSTYSASDVNKGLAYLKEEKLTAKEKVEFTSISSKMEEKSKKIEAIFKLVEERNFIKIGKMLEEEPNLLYARNNSEREPLLDKLMYVKNSKGETFLHNLISEGNFTQIEKIIKVEPKLLYARNSGGETLLHAAINSPAEPDHYQVFDLIFDKLEESSINILTVTVTGETANILNYAFQKGNAYVIERLIEKLNPEQLKKLYLDYINDISTLNQDKEKSSDNLSKEDRRELLEKIHEKLGISLSSLFKNIDSHDFEKVREIIESNPDVIAQTNEFQMAPLHAISGFIVDSKGKPDDEMFGYILDKSLEKNPKIANLKDKDKRTPLHYACLNGDLGFGAIKLLISKGADLNIPDKNGTTSFLYACEVGSIELITYLITEGGADLRKVDSKKDDVRAYLKDNEKLSPEDKESLLALIDEKLKLVAIKQTPLDVDFGDENSDEFLLPLTAEEKSEEDKDKFKSSSTVTLEENKASELKDEDDDEEYEADKGDTGPIGIAQFLNLAFKEGTKPADMSKILLNNFKKDPSIIKFAIDNNLSSEGMKFLIEKLNTFDLLKKHTNKISVDKLLNHVVFNNLDSQSILNAYELISHRRDIDLMKSLHKKIIKKYDEVLKADTPQVFKLKSRGVLDAIKVFKDGIEKLEKDRADNVKSVFQALGDFKNDPEGNAEHIKALISMDPSLLKERDPDGQSMLHKAVSLEGDIFSILFENATKISDDDFKNLINDRDGNGADLLIYASQHGTSDNILTVISHSEDLSLKNNNGKTAIECIRDREDISIDVRKELIEKIESRIENDVVSKMDDHEKDLHNFLRIVYKAVFKVEENKVPAGKTNAELLNLLLDKNMGASWSILDFALPNKLSKNSLEKMVILLKEEGVLPVLLNKRKNDGETVVESLLKGSSQEEEYDEKEDVEEETEGKDEEKEVEDEEEVEKNPEDEEQEAEDAEEIEENAEDEDEEQETDEDNLEEEILFTLLENSYSIMDLNKARDHIALISGELDKIEEVDNFVAKEKWGKRLSDVREKISKVSGFNNLLNNYIHSPSKLEEIKGYLEGTTTGKVTKRGDINLLYSVDSLEKTPFHQAVIKNQPELFQYLVEKLLKSNEKNVDILNIKDNYGKTPLHYVSSNSICEKLVKLAKVNLNIKDEHGKTPLHCAVEIGKKDIIDTLIKSGANLNETDENGKTPLHYACAGSDLKIIDLLIKGGRTELSVPDKDGNTPLHYAISSGNYEMVVKLIDAGADLNVVNKKGENPRLLISRMEPDSSQKEKLDRTIDFGLLRAAIIPVETKEIRSIEEVKSSVEEFAEVERIIKKFPDLLNAQDSRGNTPLHLAILSNKEKIVSLLLYKGADVHIPNHSNESAMVLFSQRKEYEKLHATLQVKDLQQKGVLSSKSVTNSSIASILQSLTSIHPREKSLKTRLNEREKGELKASRIVEAQSPLAGPDRKSFWATFVASIFGGKRGKVETGEVVHKKDDSLIAGKAFNSEGITPSNGNTPTEEGESKIPKSDVSKDTGETAEKPTDSSPIVK